MPRPTTLTALKLMAVPALAVLLAGCPAAPTASRDTGLRPATLECPQPRDTQAAPDTYQALSNPLAPTAANLAQGRTLYLADRPGGSCASCHGTAGDGRGPVGANLVPPPRDFTCMPTMVTLGDGLADFHESRRNGPVAVARLDGALAQQHLLAVLRHAADYHQRVHVVDLAAGGTNVAR